MPADKFIGRSFVRGWISCNILAPEGECCSRTKESGVVLSRVSDEEYNVRLKNEDTGFERDVIIPDFELEHAFEDTEQDSREAAAKGGV